MKRLTEKNYSFEELRQRMIDLNVCLIEEFHAGKVNENRLKPIDKIVQLYEVLKESPKASTAKK